MTLRHVGEFEIGLDFRADQAILAVSGAVDVLTASTLSAVLGQLVDLGYANVVLDLVALDFIDASGLGVIVDVSARLAHSSRVLTLRSATEQTQRLLAITGLSDLVRLEASDPDVAQLGAEQHSGDDSFVVDSQPTSLTNNLARVGFRPNNAVIDAALRLVTVLAEATVEGADGVSVTLDRGGLLSTIASTNDTVLRMDDHQYATGEGPCLAAAAQGRWFHIESLADEKRWPMFVPRAIEEGISSILSTPLMAADRPVGALNIYSNTERAFGPHQQELAALFASQASGILADAGADVADEQMGSAIAGALLAREIIARAEGMMMAREHIGAGAAAAKLPRAARTAGVTVLWHATAIVATAASLDSPEP